MIDFQPADSVTGQPSVSPLVERFRASTGVERLIAGQRLFSEWAFQYGAETAIDMIGRLGRAV